MRRFMFLDTCSRDTRYKEITRITGLIEWYAAKGKHETNYDKYLAQLQAATDAEYLAVYNEVFDAHDAGERARDIGRRMGQWT